MINDVCQSLRDYKELEKSRVNSNLLDSTRISILDSPLLCSKSHIIGLSTLTRTVRRRQISWAEMDARLLLLIHYTVPKSKRFQKTYSHINWSIFSRRSVPTIWFQQLNLRRNWYHSRILKFSETFSNINRPTYLPRSQIARKVVLGIPQDFAWEAQDSLSKTRIAKESCKNRI